MSGQAELRTLVAFDGRDHEELRNIMGPVARLLPISMALDAGFSFRAWVGKAQRALDQAAAWQEYFDPAAHRPAEPPIVFDFRALAGEAGDLSGRAEVSSSSRSVLSLTCIVSGSGLRLELGYGSGYGRSGVEGLLGQLVVLLERGVGDG